MLAITTVSRLGFLSMKKERMDFFLIMVGFSLYVSYPIHRYLLSCFHFRQHSQGFICYVSQKCEPFIGSFQSRTHVLCWTEVGISVVNCARLIFMQLWHLKHVCCQQLDVTLKDLNLYLGISQLFWRLMDCIRCSWEKMKENPLVSVVVKNWCRVSHGWHVCFLTKKIHHRTVCIRKPSICLEICDWQYVFYLYLHVVTIFIIRSYRFVIC